MKIALLIALIAAAPLTGVAGARQPVKPVPLSLYSGRWYEIARTPNPRERDCRAATSEFVGLSGGAFEVIETCRHASGPPNVTRSKAAMMPGSHNAKFRMSMLGGLLHPEFWILDTAPGGEWAIMATPGGHFVWVMSRRPSLPLSEKSAVMSKVAALGYSTARLEYD